MIESIIAGGYTPGVLTSIPYVVFGVLFMRAVVDEYRADTAVEAQRAPASCPRGEHRPATSRLESEVACCE